MATEQLNLRIPEPLARKIRVDAATRGVRPRDVLVEMLEERYGIQAVEPIAGQLTADETQEDTRLDGCGDHVPPASRRPRAAEQASADDPEPDGTWDGAVGCPECSGVLEHGKCADCGWTEGP